MRSHLINLEWDLEICSEIFEEGARPAVDETNDYYGGLDIQGDHIIFVNMGEDPWKYAGMTEIHDPATQSGMRAIYIDCDDCAHTRDISTPREDDPIELIEGREEIYNQIIEWLKEAGSSSVDGVASPQVKTFLS